MKTNQIRAFFERMTDDADLRRAFIEFADQHGFAITDELSEGDLDQVAGGIDTVPLPEMPRLGARSMLGIIDTNTKGIIDTNT